jgi:hypothetical protein
VQETSSCKKEGELALYPHLPFKRKKGDECFEFNGEPRPENLLGYWQWLTSNLVGNTERGSLAEYIVAMALGLADQVRND